jgi:hypothetical protein
MTKIQRILAATALLSLLGIVGSVQAVSPVSDDRSAYGYESLNASEDGDYVNTRLSRYSTWAGVDARLANSGYYSYTDVDCDGTFVDQEKFAVGPSPLTDNIIYCNADYVYGYLEVFHGDP